MKHLFWLKTKVGLFQDPRMMYLLNQPNGDTYFVLWFFLKDLAGSLNDNGLIYVSANEPMTPSLIAKAIHRRKALVEKALDVLEQIDLIQRDETGIIQLLIWDDIQDYQKDEQRRRQTRQRVARCRARKKEQQNIQEEPVRETTAAPSCTPVSEPNTSVNTVQTQHPVACPATTGKTDMTVVNHYIQRFGRINPLVGKRLLELVEDWSNEAVCKAIDIAYDNGANNINYIQAVLINSNGQPQRRENPYLKREREFDEYVDEMLRQVNEVQFWEDEENNGNSAGNDS